jgi:hypothetical protein
MKPSPSKTTNPKAASRIAQQGRIQTRLLGILLALLALATLAWWHFRNAGESGTRIAPSGTNSIALSESSKTVLNQLQAPVEIRFYSILDKATVPASVFAFVERVNLMLLDFELAGNGRITIVHYNSLSDSAAAAASSDGIQPFNLDKGSACYLGLAVGSNEKRESLADLSPQWEPALEFDLSRAIERVACPIPLPKPSAETVKADETAAREVLRAIPNLPSVSLDEGARILREQAMKQFSATLNDMQTRVGQAQQRLTQTQNGGSVTEQQTAMKHLQQLQLDQADKIKQLAAELDSKIAALKRLKTE